MVKRSQTAIPIINILIEEVRMDFRVMIMRWNELMKIEINVRNILTRQMYDSRILKNLNMHEREISDD